MTSTTSIPLKFAKELELPPVQWDAVEGFVVPGQLTGVDVSVSWHPSELAPYGITPQELTLWGKSMMGGDTSHMLDI